MAIVEDEVELVKLLQLLCKKRNIHVCFTAYDGIEALSKFKRISPKPHLVIVDYRIPVKDGLEVAKEMLKIEPKTKVIFFTSELAIKDKALNAGVSKVLIKPVSIYDIEKAIEEITETYPYVKVRLD